VTVFSRRSFLAGVAAVPFVVWLEEQGFAQAATLTRFDATSPQGQAMLKIYAQAVGKMMAAAQTPEGKPISWLFQWYTHWVRSDRTKAQEIARVYPTPSPDKDLANEMWATCQAHDGSAAREPFFLPWHRMYVFYFERIIRKVSGDNTFTLPYWDYSTADVAKHGIIPKEFRLANDPILKSLFIKNRNAGGPQLPNVNAGQPIDRFAPGALATTALKQGTYLPQGSLQGFNRALDRGLHGNVHGLTGDGQNMGAVPWAARDPVFWMHHCNIDRLWASWNKNGGRNPGGSWLTQTFVFADENGRKVVGTVNDFKEIAALNYTYDRFEPAPKPFAPIMIGRAAGDDGGGGLGSGVTRSEDDARGAAAKGRGRRAGGDAGDEGIVAGGSGHRACVDVVHDEALVSAAARPLVERAAGRALCDPSRSAAERNPGAGGRAPGRNDQFLRRRPASGPRRRVGRQDAFHQLRRHGSGARAAREEAVERDAGRRDHADRPSFGGRQAGDRRGFAGRGIEMGRARAACAS
jgi:hypothetical protein